MNIEWGSVKALGLVLATVGAAISGSAQAADYDPPVFEQTEETEVEFGTGWYIRGDLGIAFDELDDSETGNLGYPINLTAGVGYKVSDNFRVEGATTFIQNLASRSVTGLSCGSEEDPTNAGIMIPITGDCYSITETEPWAANLMANVYYDLPEILGFSPYVGAGAGVGFVRRGPTQIRTFCEGASDSDCGQQLGAGVNTTSESSFETDGQFVASFNAMVGLSYAISENTKLDVGYRYTHLGGSRRYANTGESDSWSINEVKVGMRVELW